MNKFIVTSTGKQDYLSIDVNDIPNKFILLHPILELDLVNYASFSELQSSLVLQNAIKERALIRYYDYDQYNNYQEKIFELTPMIPEEIISKPNGNNNTSPNFVHTQSLPVHTISINHNLGKFCSVEITDLNYEKIIGKYRYIDINNIEILLDIPTTFIIICN